MLGRDELKKEDMIDVGKLTGIAVVRKRQVGSIIIGCTMLAMGISFVLPKQYESTTLVQTRSAGKDLGDLSAVSAMIGGGVNRATSPVNYIGLMKSRRVIEPIIDKLAWEDEKDKPESEKFVKKHLEITNISQTNLIKITATGKTPEEAQMISQSVADNFLAMQTDMNQQTQSLLVKFLETRIEEAKKDAEEARKNFAQYQQEHKVYSPDEQAKAAVTKMNAFDEALGGILVEQKANEAKMEAVSAKLGDINTRTMNYNINDNEIVMGLRQQIVNMQVELLALRERYTEEHPAVISAKEKIKSLNSNLSREVSSIVGSKYTTLNPVQAALIKEQANAEVSLAVAKASEEAIQNRKVEKEKELEGFPQDVLEYLNLQRDTAIKEEIYTTLIKQKEQDKIQEAMESMDIQIIDSANLPDVDKPAAPRKKIFALAGVLVGIVLSFIYIWRICKRKENV